MGPDDFAELFAENVYRTAVTGTRDSLLRPPGRRPAGDLVEASAWYRSLDESSRSAADAAITRAAHAAAFGALALIDGVRSSGGTEFELAAIDPSGQRSVLNANGSLHDLFQATVMRRDGTLEPVDE